MTRALLFVCLLGVTGCATPQTPEEWARHNEMVRSLQQGGRDLNSINQAPQTQNCTIYDHGNGQYTRTCY